MAGFWNIDEHVLRTEVPRYRRPVEALEMTG
jgi:hypothetical protein